MCRFYVRAWGRFAGLAFAAGYGARGHADEPPACAQYECKTVTEYWAGTKDVVYRNLLDGTFVPTTDGIVNLFTTKSNDDLPLVNQSEWVLGWPYDTSTPWCGKDGAGVWQAYQEVCIDVDAVKSNSPGNKKIRELCTPAETGKSGKQVTNPTNNNKNKNTFPGWKNDEGGDDPPPPPP